jgi:V8-like Glu-specific endopeptidase
LNSLENNLFTYNHWFADLQGEMNLQEPFVVQKLVSPVLLMLTVLAVVVGCQTALNGYHANVSYGNGLYYSGFFQNNSPNGHGTETYISPHKDAGFKYVGEFRDGKKQGQGTETVSSPHKDAGQKYVGYFQNGIPNGHGTETYISPHKDAGAEYVGELRDAKRHGHGTETYISPHKDAGAEYVGEFRDSKRHGHGTETYISPHKDAGAEYVGEFRDSKRHGQGTYTFNSPHRNAGRKYVGNSQNGQPNGRGTETYSSPNKNAGFEYVGEFKDGKWHGQGTYTYNSPHKRAGLKFVGGFRDGKRHGQGTQTVSSPNKDAGYKYVGEYKDGKFNGQGTETIPTGDKYVGEFKDDQYNGQGTYYYNADNEYKGDKYVGEWEDGKTHGQGTYTFANGDEYVGGFKGILHSLGGGFADRNFHGLGILTYVDGRVTKGRWVSGKLFDADNNLPKAIAKKPLVPSPGSGISGSASGSGFFVSKLGHVVTNQHVVAECKSVTVGDSAKKQVPAEIVGADKRNDLALLKISSTTMASADTKSLIRKLGITIASRSIPLSSGGLLRSEDVELGERVLVSGYPYGEIFSDTIKVTGGMVSAIRGMGDDSGQFQIDAAVQPGNSGGPIYDGNGNIVGVVVSQLNKLKVAKVIGSLPENVNFGIKASTVRQFLTSAGLPTKWSNQSELVSSKNLAKIARNQTLMVVCNN